MGNAWKRSAETSLISSDDSRKGATEKQSIHNLLNRHRNSKGTSLISQRGGSGIDYGYPISWALLRDSKWCLYGNR